MVSTSHLAMKFPSPSGDILTIHGNQRLARECYMANLRPQLPILQTNHVERPLGSSIALSRDDLDPKVGRDDRLKLVDETTPLELLMDALSNWALAYNSRSAKSLRLPSSAILTSLPSPLLTCPALTLKSHPTNSPCTKIPGMSPKRN